MAQAGGSSTRRVLTASLIGTSIEFYDFYIFGTAASLVFGHLFFPTTSPTAQLMLAYATFSVAFLARPLGALTFGHFGDRIGRKTNFIASMLLMGGSTMAIGLLPTYDSIGWGAPLILSLLRFGQGFGLGGIWSGATLLATENAPPDRRALYGMIPQLGYALGFIAANGLFLILGATLTSEEFLAWGWRLPFLLSIALIGLGLWTRLHVEESADFSAAIKKEPPPRVPVNEMIRDYPRQSIAGTLGIVGSITSYYVTMVFALGYGTSVLGYSRQEFLILLLTSIPVFALGMIISGLLADKLTPVRILIGGSLSMVAAGFLLEPLLVSGSLTKVWLYLALSFFLNGICIGAFGGWMSGLFPPRVRFTGTALGYNIGGIIGAGFAPMIAQGLLQAGGTGYVGYYLSIMAVVSLIGFVLVRNTKALN